MEYLGLQTVLESPKHTERMMRACISGLQTLIPIMTDGILLTRVMAKLTPSLMMELNGAIPTMTATETIQYRRHKVMLALQHMEPAHRIDLAAQTEMAMAIPTTETYSPQTILNGLIQILMALGTITTTMFNHSRNGTSTKWETHSQTTPLSGMTLMEMDGETIITNRLGLLFAQ
jgi:hypothetical protein